MIRNWIPALLIVVSVTATASAQLPPNATTQLPPGGSAQFTPTGQTQFSPTGTTQFPPTGSQYPGGLSGGLGEPLYPFDQQDPWLHGFIQEMPAYGGFSSFRPYNYKHALSQSQVAANWGLSPTLPYSQQFWHRYGNMNGVYDRAYTSAPQHPQTAVPIIASQAPPNTAVPNRFQPAASTFPVQQPVSGPTLSPATLSAPAAAGPRFGPVPQQFSPAPQQPGISSQINGFRR